MQQVHRTIKQIESGQVPVVNLDDNHQMHYAMKNQLRKTAKFEAYNDQVKAIFLDNLAQHKLYATYPELTQPPPPMPPQPTPQEQAGLIQAEQNTDPNMMAGIPYPTEEQIPMEEPIDPSLLDLNPDVLNASLQ